MAYTISVIQYRNVQDKLGATYEGVDGELITYDEFLQKYPKKVEFVNKMIEEWKREYF